MKVQRLETKARFLTIYRPKLARESFPLPRKHWETVGSIDLFHWTYSPNIIPSQDQYAIYSVVSLSSIGVWDGLDIAKKEYTTPSTNCTCFIF